MGKKILSEDSRECLVVAYEKTKEITNEALMFGVAESTVYRLVAQKRKTGSLALLLSKRGVLPMRFLWLPNSTVSLGLLIALVLSIFSKSDITTDD